MSTVDVEAVLVAALAPLLPGVVVSTITPTDDRRPSLRITATGGPEISGLVLDRADVAWEAWHPDPVEAANLACRVRDLIDGLQGRYVDAWVLGARSTRGRSFPDVSGVPRYVGTAQILIQTA